MPRRPRIVMPNMPQHLIQRGNNRQVCFYADEDYLLYLDWLANYAAKFKCQIHAYVLMTNHVHLLATSQQSESVGLMMKALSQRYVQYINRRYKRTGTLWEGRYRSCPIQAETYLLACQRYIELNPVRANIASHPAEYRWSSYRINAQGKMLVSLTHMHCINHLVRQKRVAKQRTESCLGMSLISGLLMKYAEPPTVIMR